VSRSTKLLGRVLRNLKKYGQCENEALDEEIYGELTSGQDNIISSTEPDRILTLTFREGQEYYPLTTDLVEANDINTLSQYIKTGIALTGTKDGVNTVFTIPEDDGIITGTEQIFLNGVLQIRDTDYSINKTVITIIGSIIPDTGDTLIANWIQKNPEPLTSYKNNISEVKVVQQPVGFIYFFNIIHNTEFVNLVNTARINWTGLIKLTSISNLAQYIKTGISLTGTKNGANNVFTIPDSQILAGSEQIFLNGVLQIRDKDYTISGNTITMITLLPDTGDTLYGNWIENSTIISAFVTSGQPIIGTIIGKRLKVFPIPDSDVDGKTIDLYVYQKSSANVIDENNEPEVDDEYDKALEYFATAQFLIGKDRTQWMNDYNAEKERLKRLTHKKRGPMNRQSIPGW